MTPDLEVGVGTRVNRVKGGVVFGARAKSMEADVAEAEGAESASSISNDAGALDLGRPLSVPARYLPTSHLPDSFIEGVQESKESTSGSGTGLEGCSKTNSPGSPNSRDQACDATALCVSGHSCKLRTSACASC